MTKYPDVTVKLVGTDGNAYSIIARVRRAIASKHGTTAASKWAEQAMDVESYDKLLQLVIQTVDVE